MDQNSWDRPDTATYMMKNKNDKINYGLSKIMGVSIIVFFQDLYQVVLPLYVFEGLHGGRINYGPDFDQISKYCLYSQDRCS